MVSMIVFGILCNFLIVVPNRLKTCRSDVFFLFYNANCERLKIQVRLRGFARLITSISIGRVICPVLFKTMLIKCQSSGETLGLLLHCYLLVSEETPSDLLLLHCFISPASVCTS